MVGTVDLEGFPRPGVTVDLALMTVTGAGESPELKLLIQPRVEPAGLALPGRFVRERQTVAQTVDSVLRDKVGIEPSGVVRPRLLRLFDAPDRDSRTWAMSAAHSVSLREADSIGAQGDWLRVMPDGRLAGSSSPELLFDHAEIVAAAVAALRDRYEVLGRFRGVEADPDGFLDEEFTLHQLRLVHEAVLGLEGENRMHKDNFNRRMKDLVEPVLDAKGKPKLSDGLRGRPATVYRRSTGD